MQSHQYKSKLDYIFTNNISTFDFNSKTLYAFSNYLALHIDFIHKIASKNNTIWKLNTHLLKDSKINERINNTNLN